VYVYVCMCVCVYVYVCRPLGAGTPVCSPKTALGQDPSVLVPSVAPISPNQQKPSAAPPRILGRSRQRPERDRGFEDPDGGRAHPIGYRPLTAPEQGVVNRIALGASAYFSIQVPAEEIAEVVTQCFVQGNAKFGIKEALDWAEKFKVDPAAVAADLADLELAGRDLPTLIRQGQAPLLLDRLNLDRIAHLRPDNPKIEELKGLVNGMVVLLAPDFVPTNENMAPPSPNIGNGMWRQKGLWIR
jgi:hypothetical protein